MTRIGVRESRTCRAALRLACLVLALAAIETRAAEEKSFVDIPLVWRPTTQLGSTTKIGTGLPVIDLQQSRVDEETGDESARTPSRMDIEGAATPEPGAVNLTIRVLTLIDAREDPALIGENREEAEDGKILPIITRDSVAEWSTNRLAYLLHKFGFDIVTEGGDILVSGEVRRFFVEEINTYEGDVGLKIVVKRKDGKQLWSGIASGFADRFGESRSIENYREVISDSFLDAVQKLVQHENFVRAVTGRPRSGCGCRPGAADRPGG